MLRAVGRLVAAGVQVLGGAAICLAVFPFASAPQRQAHVGRWSARTLRALGVRWQAQGRLAQGPVLVVANHVSWLDILAVNALQPVRFVSKADVRHWPLLGWMVACGGTLFIERERKRDALRVVHQIAEALTRGDTVAVFPEGTTTDGRAVLPFHANLLQAAVATGTPVQPVALRYRDAAAPVSTAASYVGETTLVESLWAIVCTRGMEVRVEAMPPVEAAGRDRRELAHELQARIAGALEDTAGRS